MSLKTKYDNLPKPIQYIAIGGSAFILYMLYKRFFSNDKTQEETYKEVLKKIAEEEAKNKQKLTYPASQYLLFANLLNESMKYGIGDNYNAVVDTLKKMQNDKDVQTLLKAYGQRQGYVFGIPAGEPADLFTTIKKELGNEWGGLTSYKVDKINDDWKKKKIKYTI